MRSRTLNPSDWNIRSSFLLIAVCFASGILLSGPQSKQPSAPVTQKGFATPERAAEP